VTRDDFPTPGPNPPVPSWEEYDQLREAVEDYLDHQPDDPTWNDIWRALGAIMGEYQRDALIEAFGVDERAESACVRRLITDEDECPHSPLEGELVVIRTGFVQNRLDVACWTRHNTPLHSSIEKPTSPRNLPVSGAPTG
jgi:hypothetical protein